jgi:polyhydroxyalkanoate synthesis regulator phasin
MRSKDFYLCGRSRITVIKSREMKKVSLFFASLAMVAFVACSNGSTEEAAEDTMENVEETADEAADAAEETMEEAEETMDETMEDAEEAMNEGEEAMEESMEEAEETMDEAETM